MTLVGHNQEEDEEEEKKKIKRIHLVFEEFTQTQDNKKITQQQRIKLTRHQDQQEWITKIKISIIEMAREKYQINRKSNEEEENVTGFNLIISSKVTRHKRKWPHQHGNNVLFPKNKIATTSRPHQEIGVAKYRPGLHSLSLVFMMMIIAIINSKLFSQIEAIDPILNLNETFSYLIDSKSGQIIEPVDYMDFDNIYDPDESYRRNISASIRNYHLIKAFDFANYFQSDYWHYTDPVELAQSGLPVANDENCEQHLNWLIKILNGTSTPESVLFAQGQEHVNLMGLIDSFGKPESAIFSGHNLWVGSHWDCLSSNIDLVRFEEEQCLNGMPTPRCQHAYNLHSNYAKQTNRHNDENSTIIKGRYCMGKARDSEWPRDDNYKPPISYKIGLCLPESCQTSSFSRHRQQIEFLMKLNMPDFWKRRLNMTEMYCLPDERSPLRQISFSGRVILWLSAVWLLGLMCSTVIYSFYKRLEHQERKATLRKQNSESRITMSRRGAANDNEMSLTNTKSSFELNSINNSDSRHLNAISQNNELNPMKGHHSPGQHRSFLTNQSASPVVANHEQSGNMNTNTNSSTKQHKFLRFINNWPTLLGCFRALSISENVLQFREPPCALKEPGANKRLRVNLNALDAIKCICCILVIFGHIIFIHMQHLSNITHTILMSYQLAPKFLIALFNFVDTFYIISGLLTSYFIFKRFSERTFGNPLIWLYISLMRLLRLSPVYMLVFWFSKTLSIHVSSGPIWDYGTDKESIKGLCKNDHWWKSILYVGNYGTMQPLCVLPAWSIIVDSQYSLIMPILIYLVMRHKRTGYGLMLVAVVLSCLQMSYQLATQTAVKTSDMSKVRLHVYPMLSRFAAYFYNTAFNRIGPVAIGIAGGHALHLYERGKIRVWPGWMRGLGFKLVLILHLVICVLPTLGTLFDGPAERGDASSPGIFIISNATVKPIWSIVNTILLLRLITDLRPISLIAKLMSHNIWFCLGKICFISYLIHYEIILILIKSRPQGLLDPNWANLGREFSYAFLLSTICSYILYILYEAPVNNLIMILMQVDKMTKRKRALISHEGKSINGTIGEGKITHQDGQIMSEFNVKTANDHANSAQQRFQ